MSLVLDAGALIAIDRRDRRIAALLRVAQQERIPVRTSVAVVAQVWRDGARQANLARVLAGTESIDLTLDGAKLVGRLLARSGTADVVDAHLALLVADGDHVLTGDADDITGLLDGRAVAADVITVPG